MYHNILLETEGAVATITINRPKANNALDRACFRELSAAVKECAENSAVRAVVLTGAGKSFCAGGDFKLFEEMMNPAQADEENRQIVYEAGEMVLALRKCWKPVIAMVNGACMGAGMSLALACDFRVIEPSTKMGTAFIGVGFTGDTGCAYFLKEMVGLAKMSELMLSGQKLSASEIMGLGLATQLAPEGELREAAYEMARHYAQGPTASYAMQKKLFWEFFHKDYAIYAQLEANYMAECPKTEDFKELVAAFREKRPPSLSGR